MRETTKAALARLRAAQLEPKNRGRIEQNAYAVMFVDGFELDASTLCKATTAVVTRVLGGFSGTIITGLGPVGLELLAACVSERDVTAGDVIAVGDSAALSQTLPTDRFRIVEAGSGQPCLEDAWQTLIHAGFKSSRITVLTSTTSKLALMTAKIGLTLGSRVVLIGPESSAKLSVEGRAAWRKPMQRVLSAPCDAMTLKYLIQPAPIINDLEMRETLGRMVHELYVDHRTEGVEPHSALRTWDELAPGLQESCRRQADDICRKLAAIGFAVGRVSDTTAGNLACFTDQDVETLAEMEHGRWTAERLLAGWEPGPRDALRRTSPYLVSWTGLANDVREVDREAVRAIPKLVSTVGFVIVPDKQL